MKIVADTNTFLAVALDEPEREQVIQVSAGHELMAPDVLPFELGNALSAMLARRLLDTEQVTAAWEAARAVPVELREVDFPSALNLAGRFSIYAYDAYYLECALRHSAPLLTLDGGMKDVARRLGIPLVE
jgi:predicted nucleic acid-binding protein